LNDGVEGEQAKWSTKRLPNECDRKLVAIETFGRGVVLGVTRIPTELFGSTVEDERSIGLAEDREGHEDHDALEDGSRPEHPAPRSSESHEAADDWACSLSASILEQDNLAAF
jgi:hypothetical protein